MGLLSQINDCLPIYMGNSYPIPVVFSNTTNQF